MQIRPLDLIKHNLDNERFFLIYGENQDLVNELNASLIKKFNEKNFKIFHQQDLLDNIGILINYINTENLFEETNIILIKQCSDQIVKIIENIKSINSKKKIILNAGILFKNSKLVKYFSEENYNIIPCYEDNKIDLRRFLENKVKEKKIKLQINQIENIIFFSNNKRSRITDIIEKLEVLHLTNKSINDEIIENLIETKIDIGLLDIMQKNTFDVNTLEILSNKDLNPVETVISLKNFLLKILKIFKECKNQNVDNVIDNYKPAIFWKDKEKIKKTLRYWKIRDLKKLLIKLNDLETSYKKLNDISYIQQNYFISRELLKKTF